jgi:hypothetical protein
MENLQTGVKSYSTRDRQIHIHAKVDNYSSHRAHNFILHSLASTASLFRRVDGVGGGQPARSVRRNCAKL